MTNRSLGRVELASFSRDALEKAVRASFEARRGPLYNALRALNAFCIVEIVSQSTEPGRFTDRELRELAFRAVGAQLEKELFDEFRFLYCLAMGKRKFGDAQGTIAALETLIPPFAAEFRERETAGRLDRKGGPLRWLLGLHEVGSIEHLLAFADASLDLAFWTFGDSEGDADLDPRVTALMERLPR